MKVLMICTVTLSGNGIATCIINYATGLAAMGQDVHILAPEGVSQDRCDLLAENGVQLHQLCHRKAGLLSYFKQLYSHLRKQRYQVVHIHGNSRTMAIELLAAALAGVPVRIAHSHNTSCNHMRAHKLFRPIFELCINGRFACSQEAGRWLFGKKPFTVIRNGIDLNQYRPGEHSQMRKALEIPEHCFVLGHVGKFVEAKNHTFLLQLMRQLQSASDRDCRLLLVGDGPLEAQIRQEVADSGLSDLVIFTGSVPNTAPYLHAMDIMALPSLYEGLPFVLIEAQAAGVQCLVSDRVSSDTDISQTLRFLPIDSTDPWQQAIRDFQPWDRVAASANACEKLTEAGYHIHSNIQGLYESYQRLIPNKG